MITAADFSAYHQLRKVNGSPRNNDYPSFFKTMRLLSLSILLGLTAMAIGSPADVTTVAPDLVKPPVVSGEPLPGKRVLQSLAAFQNSSVRHALYLPTDWVKEESYPVIAEFSGNGGTVVGGQAEQGYGISGGKGFIWVTLPFVSEDGQKEMDWWWGNPDQTADYAKVAIESICNQWGGNANAVILTGYSRGAIACNYIGLRNDAMAKLWLGMVAVSHYDNRNWKQSEAEQALRVERLRRLGKTPQYVCGEMQLTDKHSDARLLSMVRERGFTDIAIATRELKLKSMLEVERIQNFIQQNHPEAVVTFDAFPWVNHDGGWILRDTPERTRLRKWVSQLVSSAKPGGG